MRLTAVHLSVLFILGLSCAAELAYTQVRLPVLQFDFSGSQTGTRPDYTLITPSSRYSSGQSFGLLSDSLTSIEKPHLVKALGAAEADGLSKDGPIEFRVDLPRGRYVVEVIMDGGLLATWHGEISVNGTMLETTCESFGYSAESEYAPPYWGFMHPFETVVDHAILRVHARGQRTAINTVAFYPWVEGTVRLADGIFETTDRARAPNIDLAVKLINRGKITEASRIIDAMPAEWNLDRADLLFALASRPETQTPRQMVESAAAILSKEYLRTKDQGLRLSLRLAELYLLADQHYREAGWQWARDLDGMGIFGNCEIAAISSAEVASISEHPLWPASIWHLGRTCYWLWVEQHVPHMIARADSLFRLYRQLYPDHALTGVYLAESGAHGADVSDSSSAPRWAALQKALASRLMAIIQYWCNERQGSNGEFGGKYDDDVEMLRWWPFARVGIDDSVTLAGMRRLVNGIWNSSWISNGWCAKVRDVEHSSEPVADTQPMMIAFDHGNPLYVERCMQSVKLALELWTARNSRGHRHFRSSWYSSTEVDTTTPKDCDVPYNTRTVKAIRWFAWYTRHPEALRFLREWADAWLEDCLRTDTGKPKGIVPAAIRFSDDAVGGHADNWHHPGLFWDYYDYHGGTDMLAEFVSCYQLTGDPKYLKPIELSLQLVQGYSSAGEKPGNPGSEAWAASILSRSAEFWEVIEIWRLLTGDTRFDTLLLQNGSPYLKYRLASDTHAIEEWLTGVLKTVNRTYPLMTTEGYFTDRIEVRDQRGRDENGASVLESMYLGAPLASLFYPFGEVFWKDTDSTISALIEQASPGAIRIRVYNHSAVPKRGTATLLRLEPGEYEIVQGIDGDNNGVIDRVTRQETRMISRRDASCSFSFSPRTEEVVLLRKKKPLSEETSTACDLAMTSEELKTTSASNGEVVVTIPVHNIGTADAVEVTVELSMVSGDPHVVKKVAIQRISAPLDLVAKQESVSFRIPSRPGRYRIRVSSAAAAPEITHDNNAVEFSL